MYLELGNCFSGIYRFGHSYCDSAVPPDMLKAFGYEERNDADDGDDRDDGEAGCAETSGAA